MALFLVEESHDLPLCRLQVTIPMGAASDQGTEDVPLGLCHFATELMRRGAGGKSRAQLDESLDAMGASLSVACHQDSVCFDLTVLKEKLSHGYALLRDVLWSPDFSPEEAERLKREISSQLDEIRDDDGSLAEVFFARALYTPHPYGRMITGNRENIPQWSAEKAKNWYHRCFLKQNIIIGAAGDISEKELRELFGADLAKHPSDPPTSSPSPRPLMQDGMRVILVDKPERTQSQILLGHLAPAWNSPDWLPLHVAMTAFGGTFTSTLMQEVRVKRGFSYGATASIGAAKDPRSLVMHVFPSAEQTPETIDLVLKLYQTWPTQVTKEEISFAQTYLAKSHAFSIQTPEARLRRRTHLLLCNMPERWLQDFPNAVQQLSFERVQQALQSHAQPANLLITLVGTASTLTSPLKKQPSLAKATWSTVSHDSYV